MNKTVILTILTSALLAGIVALGVIFTVGFVRNMVNMERVPLENGGIVRIEETETRRIFFERVGQAPASFHHTFTFTNIADGHIQFCYTVFGSSRYSIGSTHGVLISAVDLTAGDWIMEFEPGPADGRFVWGADLARYILTFVLQIIAVTFSFLGLLTVLVLLIIKIFRNKSNA